MDALTDQVKTIWSPGGNFAQWALLECPIFEVFFGGARGGGKTDGVLGDWMRHANDYGVNASGLMLRRTRTELMDTVERSRMIYGPLKWTYNEQEKTWRDPQRRAAQVRLSGTRRRRRALSGPQLLQALHRGGGQLPEPGTDLQAVRDVAEWVPVCRWGSD